MSSHFIGELETVVIGVAVVVELQNMVVKGFPEESTKRLPNGCRVESQAVGADGTGIEVAPIHQVASECTDVCDADRGLVGQRLLDREVVGVIHGRLEIAHHLYDVERRDVACRVRAVDVEHSGLYK